MSDRAASMNAARRRINTDKHELRVEMETAMDQAREAQQEIRSLRTRLARTHGEEIAEKHPEHSGSSATVKDPGAPRSSNYS